MGFDVKFSLGCKVNGSFDVRSAKLTIYTSGWYIFIISLVGNVIDSEFIDDVNSIYFWKGILSDISSSIDDDDEDDDVCCPTECGVINPLLLLLLLLLFSSSSSCSLFCDNNVFNIVGGNTVAGVSVVTIGTVVGVGVTTGTVVPVDIRPDSFANKKKSII